MTSHHVSSTNLLVAESQRRQIETIFLSDVDPGMVQLVHSTHQELIYFSRTNGLGSVTMRAFDTKPITSALLRRGGFPVAEEIITDDLEVAVAFMRRHQRVVVKPIQATGGARITTSITTEPLLRRAFERAQLVHPEIGAERRVVVQEHVVGEDCRVLIVDQKYVFAIQRLPASVVGDGKQTVSELMTAWNATRNKGAVIQLNTEARELLADQHLTAESVPAAGHHVLLAYVSNYHAGGRLRGVTNELGSEIRQMALSVATYFAVPLVGIDFMTQDHRQAGGSILELNGTPDITIHHFPDEGEKHDVASTIIDMLFPETAER